MAVNPILKKPLICVLFALAGAFGAHAQRTFEVAIADSTYLMKQYWFVLYSKGDGPQLDSLQGARLQAEHLAHQSAQAERGLIVMAGPFGKGSGSWRGMLLYDCGTEEEVKSQLDADPLVKAGRLRYEIRPWYGAVGTRLK
jgi:uncharacterized protein YciI